MSKIQESNLLKAIIYITIPYLVILIILNSIAIAFYMENEEDVENYSYYYNTEEFSNSFLSKIYNNVKLIEKPNSISIEGVDLTLEQEKEEINYKKLVNYGSLRNFNVLMIDKQGNAYTNVTKTIKTDTIGELKDNIINSRLYWIYENQNVESNIENLQYNQVAYKNVFQLIQQEDITIYVSIKNDVSAYKLDEILYNISHRLYKSAPVMLILQIAVLILEIVYLILGIGHKKEVDGIYTNKLDNIPLEILTILCIGIVFLEVLLLSGVLSIMRNMVYTGIFYGIVIGYVMYATIAVYLVTIIRRIKAKILIKNTLTYKIFQTTKKIFRNISNDILENTPNKIKLIVFYVGFIVISSMLLLIGLDTEGYILILILIGFWFIVYRYLRNELNTMYKIRNQIKALYDGDVKEKLYIDEYNGELKQVAIELNDISGGLSNAIEQSLKSERLKTELITNVSHDIKTPLTSIINYVDLLKEEKIEDPKIKEYLDVLDNKSQRLKKLTEDLVEASKASSGNIKLNLEKLNIKELIQQINAEFVEKFKENNLEIIETLPEQDIFIQADSKYMYRILENLYINIYKYALENSRVYIDVENKQESVQIQLKNISKEQLNISPDELMQRFVRGDSSRTTEGSGLGISIAKSLTELQNGTFNIYLDGDLFKIIIEFKI